MIGSHGLTPFPEARTPPIPYFGNAPLQKPLFLRPGSISIRPHCSYHDQQGELK